VEVHQPTNTEIAHTEVGGKLGVNTREKGGDGFDFWYGYMYDHDVGAKAQWNRHAFVNNRFRQLSFEADVGTAELEGHAFSIHRFHQAWTNGTMDPLSRIVES
jgi:hypothetical protein